jgi:hypothetical protein
LHQATANGGALTSINSIVGSLENNVLELCSAQLGGAIYVGEPPQGLRNASEKVVPQTKCIASCSLNSKDLSANSMCGISKLSSYSFAAFCVGRELRPACLQIPYAIDEMLLVVDGFTGTISSSNFFGNTAIGDGGSIYIFNSTVGSVQYVRFEVRLQARKAPHLPRNLKQGSEKRVKLKNENAFPAFPAFWRWKRMEMAQEISWQNVKTSKNRK